MSKETIKCKCGGTMHHSDDMENPFAGTDDRRPFFQCEDCGQWHLGELKNKQIVHLWCQIVRPGVQSALYHGAPEPGWRFLERAMRSVSCWKAGRRNWREEGAAAGAFERRHGAGSAFDAGFLTGEPRAPLSIISRTREAVTAGLPPEIEARCVAWLRLIGE